MYIRIEVDGDVDVNIDEEVDVYAYVHDMCIYIYRHTFTHTLSFFLSFFLSLSLSLWMPFVSELPCALVFHSKRRQHPKPFDLGCKNHRNQLPATISGLGS